MEVLAVTDKCIQSRVRCLCRFRSIAPCASLLHSDVTTKYMVLTLDGRPDAVTKLRLSGGAKVFPATSRTPRSCSRTSRPGARAEGRDSGLQDRPTRRPSHTGEKSSAQGPAVAGLQRRAQADLARQAASHVHVEVGHTLTRPQSCMKAPESSNQSPRCHHATAHNAHLAARAAGRSQRGLLRRHDRPSMRRRRAGGSPRAH